MNTNTQHTPGPWKIKKDRFSQSVWAGNERIAEMMGWGKNRRRANARIVAAAPDLLYALKEAKSMLETAKAYFPKSIKNRDRFSLLNVLANAVDPAIAKAEGGAQ